MSIDELDVRNKLKPKDITSFLENSTSKTDNDLIYVSFNEETLGFKPSQIFEFFSRKYNNIESDIIITDLIASTIILSKDDYNYWTSTNARLKKIEDAIIAASSIKTSQSEDSAFSTYLNSKVKEEASQEIQQANVDTQSQQTTQIEEVKSEPTDVVIEEKPKRTRKKKDDGTYYSVAIGILEENILNQISAFEGTKSEAIDFINKEICLKYFKNNMKAKVMVNLCYDSTQDINLEEWFTLDDLVEMGAIVLES